MNFYNPASYRPIKNQVDRIHLISPVLSARVHFNFETGFFKCLSTGSDMAPCCQVSKSNWRCGAVIIVYLNPWEAHFKQLFECCIWFFGNRTKMLLEQCDLLSDLKIICTHFEYQTLEIDMMENCLITEMAEKDLKIWDTLDQMKSEGLEIIEQKLFKKLSLSEIQKLYDYQLVVPETKKEIKVPVVEKSSWQTYASRKIIW